MCHDHLGYFRKAFSSSGPLPQRQALLRQSSGAGRGQEQVEDTDAAQQEEPPSELSKDLSIPIN